MGQFEDLRLFALIVENHGISRAAEKMHIAKSAVSRRLGLLEERFGARLIDRRPGVWEVTGMGRELYQRAVRVVSDVEDISSDFADVAQNLIGPLTISVPREYGISHLSGALIEFKAHYPEIQLTVDFDDRTVDLSRENYDFAIRISPDIDDNIVAERIGSARHLLCASPAYLENHGHPENLGAILDHDLLHFGTARRASWQFSSENGKTQLIDFQPALNSNSGEFLLKAALQGLGIVRLPNFIVSSAIKSGKLVAVLPNVEMEIWGVFLIHAEDRRLNRRMRLFAEEMKIACLKNYDALL